MDGYTIRYRKLINNKLLHRLQMGVEIIHPNAGTIAKQKLREQIAKAFKSKVENVVVYNLDTVYGGGRTSGFAMIYSDSSFLKKYEANFSQRRIGIDIPKKTTTRRARKELKNKQKKVRGIKKAKVGVGKKK